MTIRTRLPLNLAASCGLAALLCLQIDAAIAQSAPARRAASAAAAVRVVGPMVGAVTPRSARVWAQLEGVPGNRPAEVWLEYWADRDPNATAAPRKRTDKVMTHAALHWTVHLPLDRLEPGTRYQYKVLWKTAAGQGASASATLKTDSHWQFRTDPPALRILAGSCAYTNDPQDDRPGAPYGRSTKIFQSMAERQPDLTLWMGDNIYFLEPDFGDETAMSSRYDKWRALTDMQALLRQGSHAAIWDDHDYGPNNSNGAYVHKDKSLKLFQRYWNNPSYGVPGLPGVFTSQVMGDAEFFLIDNRWYRDSDLLIDEDKRMLGSEQLRWLKNSLLASTATWKFIVSGSQILNLNNQFEGWNRFPRESQEFLDWLERQRVPGVVFLSGDRHFSAMLKVDRPSTYPLYELTCSPLTSGPYENPSRDVVNNPRLIAGSAVTRNSFCELELTGARGSRKLAISIRNGNGEPQWQRDIQEAELR